MKTSNRYTLEERKKIENFLKRGIKPNQISTLLGRHPKSMTKEIKKGLVDGTYVAEIAHAKVKKAKGFSPVPFTAAQQETIHGLMKNNETLNTICVLLKCGKRRLTKFLEQSNIKYDPSGIKKYASLQIKDISFEERLCSLEEQVKILFDNLRERK